MHSYVGNILFLQKVGVTQGDPPPTKTTKEIQWEAEEEIA
jgi:hypothetical protein